MTIAEQLTILNDNLDAVGTETNTQSDIIDEIIEVLEGKAAGGEDVSEETSEYTSLTGELEEVINSLPDASGASLDTCSITISADSKTSVRGMTYTTVENGEVVHKLVQSIEFNNGGTLECLCGSMITCIVSSYGAMEDDFNLLTPLVSGNVSVDAGIFMKVYEIVASKGQSGSLNFTTSTGDY